jgi:hypothetical protein
LKQGWASSHRGFFEVKAEIKRKTPRRREVECPRCKGRFSFRRANTPYFDAAGFESYQLDCRFCRVVLTGIIDPFDGTLLLTACDCHPFKHDQKLISSQCAKQPQRPPQ